jgi:NodT family efflux transporter outer membrane factor (OMF) lipoprotein
MKPRLALSVLLLLASCTVGPDYKRPPAPVPAAYKETGWKTATPHEAIGRGPWWSIYNDPVLDGLEREIDISNQNLKAAEAAYRQARAVVGEAYAGYFPTVSLGGSGTRTGQGGNVASSNFGRNTTVDLTADATWSVDLWGRIRRTVESDVANAQASAADIANARLSAQAQLAVLYFELRAADQQERLLDSSVTAFTQSLQITQNQYNAGVAAQTDVVTAETQLEQTRAQAIAVGVQRAQFEHAIATLIGSPSWWKPRTACGRSAARSAKPSSMRACAARRSKPPGRPTTRTSPITGRRSSPPSSRSRMSSPRSAFSPASRSWRTTRCGSRARPSASP